MTKQDLVDQIEAEFAWLSPDEKQKLYVIMKSNWNSAIAHAAEIVTETNNFQQTQQTQQVVYQASQLNYLPQQQISNVTNKQRINKLKL